MEYCGCEAEEWWRKSLRFSVALPVLAFVWTSLGLLTVVYAQRPWHSARTSVIITNKTVVVPHKAGSNVPRAVVQYPELHGGSDAAVLRKLQKALLPATVFETSFAEMKDDVTLEAIHYTVNFNRNGLLDLTFVETAEGAYPTSYDKHVRLDLRTGNPVNTRDVFRREALPVLVSLLTHDERAAERSAVREATRQGVDLRQYFPVKITEESLESFSVGKTGITFWIEYDIPHVIQALAPPGRFFFPYARLRPYLLPNCPYFRSL